MNNCYIFNFHVISYLESGEVKLVVNLLDLFVCSFAALSSNSLKKPTKLRTLVDVVNGGREKPVPPSAFVLILLKNMRSRMPVALSYMNCGAKCVVKSFTRVSAEPTFFGLKEEIYPRDFWELRKISATKGNIRTKH